MVWGSRGVSLRGSDVSLSSSSLEALRVRHSAQGQVLAAGQGPPGTGWAGCRGCLS